MTFEQYRDFLRKGFDTYNELSIREWGYTVQEGEVPSFISNSRKIVICSEGIVVWTWDENCNEQITEITTRDYEALGAIL